MYAAIDDDNPDAIRYLLATHQVPDPDPRLLIKMYEYAQSKSVDVNDIMVYRASSMYRAISIMNVIEEIADRL